MAEYKYDEGQVVQYKDQRWVVRDRYRHPKEGEMYYIVRSSFASVEESIVASEDQIQPG